MTHVYSRAPLLCYPTMCYNKLVSKARKKWLQLSAIIYNTSNGDVRRLLLAWNQMQKMFVIHYRMLVTFVKMIYAVNSKIISMTTDAIFKFLNLKRLLFTFVLNWVFLQFPWQRQAFWNLQASKPFIHMPYNISIKFHPIPSTLNFSRFFCGNGGHSEISKPQNYVYTCQTKFLENFIQFRAP